MKTKMIDKLVEEIESINLSIDNNFLANARKVNYSSLKKAIIELYHTNTEVSMTMLQLYKYPQGWMLSLVNKENPSIGISTAV